MSEPGRLFDDGASLGEARAWLREQAGDRGARCPCCTQLAKVYRRTIHYKMAADLIRAWRTHGQDWFHLRAATQYSGGDGAKLRYWDLMVEEPTRRPDGGRAGWWSITDLGAWFVRGQVAVPKDAYVYDNRLLRLDAGRGMVRIRDTLGDHFDYDELMSN